ncbi:MAG: hypothetical protein WCJ35_28890 [Planctomycetota bacterium]
MLKQMDSHAGRRYPTSAVVRGREDLGRVIVIKTPGPVHTRVGRMAADGTVDGITFLVFSADVDDRQPIPQNQLKRPMNHHTGRVFPFKGLVRGRENEGPMYIVQRGAVETRVVAIGSDGNSTGPSHVVPARDVIDIQSTHGSFRQEVAIDDRGNMVIPATLRNRFKLAGRSVVEVIEQTDGFLVRPLHHDINTP